MQLFKPNEEQDLARMAVILPLLSLLSLMLPAALLSFLGFFLPERVCKLILIFFLLAWLFWVVALWLRAVKIVRQAKTRKVSQVAFHVLQAFGIIYMGLNFYVRGERWMYFSCWLVCLDVALAVFYLSYFLLAMFSGTKIPWHAASGFGIVCLSLIYASYHNPFSGHGF
jgi:hypothetical protein